MPSFDRADVDGSLAGQHAGARLDALRQARHPVDQFERGAHGALGVVFLGGGRAPDRHDRVADEFLDRAAVALDDLARHVEVARQRVANVFRVTFLGERREADQVREQDADHAALGSVWACRRRRCGGGWASLTGCYRQVLAEPASAYPHSAQNLAPGWYGVEQLGQAAASGLPHSAQNLEVAALGVPQLVQFKRNETLSRWNGHEHTACARDTPSSASRAARS